MTTDYAGMVVGAIPTVAWSGIAEAAAGMPIRYSPRIPFDTPSQARNFLVALSQTASRSPAALGAVDVGSDDPEEVAALARRIREISELKVTSDRNGCAVYLTLTPPVARRLMLLRQNCGLTEAEAAGEKLNEEEKEALARIAVSAADCDSNMLAEPETRALLLKHMLNATAQIAQDRGLLPPPKTGPGSPDQRRAENNAQALGRLYKHQCGSMLDGLIAAGADEEKARNDFVRQFAEAVEKQLTALRASLPVQDRGMGE